MTGPNGQLMPMSWQDLDPQCQLGVGVSRTGDKRAKLFDLNVTFPASIKPMKESIRAASARQAKAFAKARYPKATSIEILTYKGR